MSINGLTIDDATIAKFKGECAQQYQRGGPRVCQKARTVFFADMKRQHGGEEGIKPHLRDLFVQLERWEVEIFTNGNTHPPLPAGHE